MLHGSAAYGSSTCLFSSTWEARQVFDFDSASKVHYLLDTRIDDSIRLTQERFGELDWSILFDVVSDPEWGSLIWKIKDAETAEEATKAADKILDLLSRLVTKFTFHSEHGQLAIRAKKVSAVANRVAAVAQCLELYHTPLTALLGPAGAAGLSAVAHASTLVSGIGATVPGVMWAHQKLTRRALRTAVSPAIYIGSLSAVV